MTVAELMALADALATNALPMDIKLFELNRLEQRIRVDTLGQDPEELAPYPQEEPEAELYLEERYRDVYLYWITSMIFFHQREMEDYENQRAMFETAWSRFERDCCIALDRSTACGSAADAGS